MEKSGHVSAVFDYHYRPYRAVWEVTRACDVGCAHCRISAQPQRNYLELSTAEARDLVDQIAAVQVQRFVIDGGDPLKRPDIFELVNYAASLGLGAVVSPSATQHLGRPDLQRLREAGASAVSLALDGSTAALHDAIRGMPGGYDRTILAVEWARGARIPMQIHTTVCRANLADLPSMARLLESLNVVSWQVIFPVPRGRDDEEMIITPDEAEALCALLHETSHRAPFEIVASEGPQYRRYALQQRMPHEPSCAALVAHHVMESAPAPEWLDQEKGSVFISHVGDIYPNAFLPLSAGNIRRRSLSDIYLNSPLFASLRDGAALGGKCGICEYRDLCGGSRARAFAWSGDPLAEDPFCAYQPVRG
jgi:radical SAM protein